MKKRDRNHRFELVSFQSDKGKKLLGEGGVDDLQTVVLLYNQQRFERSDAAIEILCGLGGSWKLCRVFHWIPRWLRDGVYNFVARHRYQWFGKTTSCPIENK